MKKILLAGVALVSVASGSAMAADLAARPVYTKAPVMAPVYNWTGFYIGGNVGYSWGRSATSYTVTGLPGFSTSQNMDGWVGGGQAGYNWQFNQNWVFGVEADIQGTGQNGTATLPSVVFVPPPGAPAMPNTTTTASLQSKLPWFGTARLRLGVLPSDHGCLYATGGLAVGEVESNASVATARRRFSGARPTGDRRWRRPGAASS